MVTSRREVTLPPDTLPNPDQPYGTNYPDIRPGQALMDCVRLWGDRA